MTSRRSRGALVLAVMALALAGCGDEDEPASEAAELAGVMNAWTAAYAEGDGETLCGLVTEEAAEQMRDPYGELLGEDSKGPYGATCEEAVANQHREAGRSEAEDAPPVGEDAVTIEGDSAVVQPDGGFCTWFAKENGRWYLAGLPLPPPDDPPFPPCEPGGSGPEN